MTKKPTTKKTSATKAKSVKGKESSEESTRAKKTQAETDILTTNSNEQELLQDEAQGKPKTEVLDIEVIDDDIDDFDELEDEDSQEGLILDYDSPEELDGLSDFSENSAENNDNTKKLPAKSGHRLPSTSSTKDALQMYLREIGRFPMLKPDEEFELAKRVHENGDQEAAYRLVSSHLRLVVKIAMTFQRRWMQNVLDLIQEGNVGLMRAVQKFDHQKGIKFSYYAAFWVRAYILKFIMDNWRMVKVGTTQDQRKLFYNLNRERQKLINEGYNPDAALLSKRLGVNEQQVVEMQQRLDTADVSLNAPINTESGTVSRIDFLPALDLGIEEAYAGNEIAAMLRHKLDGILPSLSDKELFILENRLLTDDPVTLREIGEKYTITRERVRQLESRLLQKLRAYFTKEIADFSEEWISPQ